MRSIKFLLLISIFFGCKRTMQTECGTLRCPPVRNTVYLSTIGLDGKPTKASYIETYNTRSGKKQTNLQDPPNYRGRETFKYKLFFNPWDFSTAGDRVTVLLRSSSGKEFTLDHVIKGGKCTCEVVKLSGPSVFTLD